MPFLTTNAGSALVNRPRIQPEILMKASLFDSIKMGRLESYTSGRVNRSGGTASDFTSSGADEDKEWQAIKVIAAGDGEVDAVLIPLSKTGSPAGTATVSLYTDDGTGLPSAIVGGASATITIDSAVATSVGYIRFTWSSNAPTLNQNQTYWVVIKTSGYTYSNGVTELILDTDANGSSEVCKYDANGSPAWTTSGATVGANVIVCIGVFTDGDAIAGSDFDFKKYALFATAFSPVKGRDLSLSIAGTCANSGRSNRANSVAKDFTSTGADEDGEWWAIKFTALASITLTTVQVPLIIVGTPAGTASAMIYSDDSGLPDSQNNGDSDAVTIATGVSISGGYVTFTWSGSYPTLTKDTDYWVVIKTTGYTYTDSTTELSLQTDTSGSSEVAKYDANGVPTWTTAGATVGANVKVGGTVVLTGTATLSSLAGLDTAELVEISGVDNNGWGDLTDVTILDGYPNGYETIDFWAIPDENTENYDRILFMRGADINGGATWMPVADRFDTNRAIIRIRRDPSITITKDYETYETFGKYRNRLCTIIMALHPAGGGAVSEYIILAHATITTPINQPDNAMISISAEGEMSQLMIYAP